MKDDDLFEMDEKVTKKQKLGELGQFFVAIKVA